MMSMQKVRFKECYNVKLNRNINKQLLDEVFVISRIIEPEARLITLIPRP